ncbi:hypothetical protein CY34DRAFT_93852, partial [Suillus luteus UH-Slu-Lm8-n1]
TGVGKSSLIQQAFGIIDVDISDDMPGEATIDKPLISSENARFVLHDSKGFEAGDSDSFKAAKDFIDGRRKTPTLAVRDQIHAVWLCLSIPHGGGSLLERGVEELLKSRKQILGDSAQPKREYESTIRQLIDLTTTNVEKFVDSEAALAMMIAQRAHIGKVSLATAVFDALLTYEFLGYWRGIAVGMNFIGFTMLDCFSKIHEDIVGVWNLYDPDGVRYISDFMLRAANVLLRSTWSVKSSKIRLLTI